ncbi:hypothetical protein K438DRAFT_1785413 [Mycena galopus ATCC 62051]|nr:hypothetical protein K438DRAFT_1785413 [Mycena galopus ATCC 62051]
MAPASRDSFFWNGPERISAHKTGQVGLRISLPSGVTRSLASTVARVGHSQIPQLSLAIAKPPHPPLHRPHSALDSDSDFKGTHGRQKTKLKGKGKAKRRRKKEGRKKAKQQKINAPNPARDLLEAVLGLAGGYVALLDRCVDVAAGAELERALASVKKEKRVSQREGKGIETKRKEKTSSQAQKQKRTNGQTQRRVLPPDVSNDAIIRAPRPPRTQATIHLTQHPSIRVDRPKPAGKQTDSDRVHGKPHESQDRPIQFRPFPSRNAKPALTDRAGNKRTDPVPRPTESQDQDGRGEGRTEGRPAKIRILEHS